MRSIDLQTVPQTYRSIANLPEILGQIDHESDCTDPTSKNKVTSKEALCALDFFGDSSLTLEDLKAARNHSGITLFATLSDSQMIELVQYFSENLAGFPKLNQKFNTNNQSQAVMLSTPLDAQPKTQKKPTNLPKIEAPDNSKEKIDVDLFEKMDAKQRERAIRICDQINSHEISVQEYQDEIVDLLSEIPLADNEKGKLNCNDL